MQSKQALTCKFRPKLSEKYQGDLIFPYLVQLEHSDVGVGRNLWTIIYITEIDKRSVGHLGTQESGLQIIDDEPMFPK